MIILTRIYATRKPRFVIGFRLRLGRWEIATFDDICDCVIGFVLWHFNKSGGSASPAWQWKFRKGHWPDDEPAGEPKEEWPEVVG